MNCNEIITRHMPWAENLAKAKKAQMGKSVYYEDLKSAAYRGLVDAAQRFDDSIGSFKNYAAGRVKGEMSAYLKELQWGPLTMNSIADAYYVADRSDIFDLIPAGVRQIFVWYYVYGYTMLEIAVRLGVTKSMVSKIMKTHKKLLARRKNEILG